MHVQRSSTAHPVLPLYDRLGLGCEKPLKTCVFRARLRKTL